MALYPKYPSMERQDLTQGQLGSFKFIPVDDVPRNHPHPLLTQQFFDSIGQNAMLKRALFLPDLSSDHKYYNTHIKPTLEDSRLRLGPATVRAAVDSVNTSPRASARYKDAAMRPSAQNFVPGHFRNSSDMDTTISTYTPKSDFNLADASILDQSLVRALVTEQQAHEVTKAALEEELIKREDAESEVQRLADHCKGLLNSIHLLQSTVRHMVQKEIANEIPDSRALDQAVRDFHAQVTQTGFKDSILHDPLGTFKKNQHSKADAAKVQNSELPPDTDSLEKVGANDKSGVLQGDQIVHKQAKLSPTLTKSSEIQFPPVAVFTEDKDVTDLASELSEKLRFTENAPSTIVATASASNHLLPTVEIVPEETALRNISHPMLELPASFLAKYGKPPIQSQPKTHSNENDGLGPAQIVKRTNNEPNPGKKSSDLANSPANGGSESISLTKLMFMPVGPILDWKIGGGDGLFASGKAMNECRRSQPREYQDLQFFQHPIRYLPSTGEENILRTVMIDFIPVGATYKDVLGIVRGGSLESIQMYGPIGQSTGFSTARVVFNQETGAQTLYNRGQSPGLTVLGQKVRVWQVLEPTYPKGRQLYEDVFEEGYTRFLVIAPSTENKPLVKVLHRKLKHQIEDGFVLDVGRAQDGTPMIEFTSVPESIKALRQLMSDPDFGGTHFDFEEDYCEEPYE